MPVDISRTGYTGDLAFEVWMPWRDAVKVSHKLQTGQELASFNQVGSNTGELRKGLKELP